MANQKYDTNYERDLLEKAKIGDLSARRKLHREYKGLLDKIVYQNFSYSPQPISAIRSEAEELLDKCIDSWDPTMNNKPSTYITSYIKNKLNRYVNTHKQIIRTPEQYAWKTNKYRDSVEALTSQLKRDPSDIEIADYMNSEFAYNLTPKDIDRIRRETRSTTLASTVIGQSDDNATLTVRDVMFVSKEDPLKQYMLSLRAREVNDKINTMQEPHKSVLEYHLGINGKPKLSLRDIAVKMGMNKYRIQVIIDEAKEMLS